MECPRLPPPQSALMPVNLTTLPHFSVSSAISLPKSAEVQHRAAQLRKSRLHLGIVESRVDLLIELVDDLDRRGLRCADAETETRLEPRQKPSRGRDIRKYAQARPGAPWERAQPPSFNTPNR